MIEKDHYDPGDSPWDRVHKLMMQADPPVERWQADKALLEYRDWVMSQLATYAREGTHISIGQGGGIELQWFANDIDPTMGDAAETIHIGLPSFKSNKKK